MDVSSIASGLGSTASLGSSVGGIIDASLLKAVDNLSATQSALLFASIGLGSGVDTFA